jgi:dTDP-4-amino-4,6-dideoxygalactose transaminase
MIELVKPNEPDQERLEDLLAGIRYRGHYTNHGPLVEELEKYLSVHTSHRKMLYTANGTLALQLVLKALAGKGEVLTTPYSYVATTNAAVWQGNKVRFADLAPGSLFPDPVRLADMITSETALLLLTYVYGFPGPVKEYRRIADDAGIPLIIDAAHAFDVTQGGEFLDRWADVACYSFHATKTFHTVEGGGIAVSDDQLYEQLFNFRAFGHRGDDYLEEGINAKGSEVHAAYGLAQCSLLAEYKKRRKEVYESYTAVFNGLPMTLLDVPSDLGWNYGYFPVVLATPEERVRFQEHMDAEQIRTRRYFYPSLNRLPHLGNDDACPNSEDLASKAVCIPIHGQLTTEEVQKVIQGVKSFWS